MPELAEDVDPKSLTIVEFYRYLGHLEAARRSIRLILEDRFGKLPETLLQQLEEITDLKRLHEALMQSWQVASLADFRL